MVIQIPAKELYLKNCMHIEFINKIFYRKMALSRQFVVFGA